MKGLYKSLLILVITLTGAACNDTSPGSHLSQHDSASSGSHFSQHDSASPGNHPSLHGDAPLQTQQMSVHTATTEHVLASSQRSLSYSAGQIQMTYKLVSPPVVGVQSQLALRFELAAGQPLSLRFSDNSAIKLLQHVEAAWPATDNGIITVLIDFIPVQAGKTYLKLIASTHQGKSIRAFAIALPVADPSGSIPKKQKERKSRINLPSGHQY